MAKKIDQLKIKRKQYIAALARLKDFIDKLKLEEIDRAKYFEVESRFKKLPSICEQFETTQSEIEVLEDSDFDDGVRTEFENSYFGLHAAMHKIIEDFKKGESVSAPSKPDFENLVRKGLPAIHLPVMNLPSFNGEYDRWLEFRDSFLALVDSSPSLSNVQKFYHLRSCLQKDVLETIKSIPICDSNYKLAWQHLTDRYERSHLITNNHVNSIINFSRLSKESSQELRNLFNCINNNLKALKSLGAAVEHWDLLLIPIISAKLDSVTRREWEKLAVTKKEVSVNDLLNLINNRSEYLERLEINKTVISSSFSNSKPSHVKSPNLSKNSNCFHVQSKPNNCKICEGNHPLFKCDSFLKLGINERYQKVKEKGLCLNCLKSTHLVYQCRSSKCQKCQKSHHTLLHRETSTKVGPQDSSQTTSSNPTNNPTTVATTQTQLFQNPKQSEQIILSTAIVLIKDSNNRTHRCRALLDNGAMSNFITNDLCNKLGLKKQKINFSISGVGQVVQNTQHMVNIIFKSIFGSEFETQCLVIDRVTSNLPLHSFDKSKIAIPNHVKLADPTFNQSGPIDLLLGSSIFWDLLQAGYIRIPCTRLILKQTKLGWIVGGSSFENSSNPYTNRNKVNCLSTIQNPLEIQLKKFWEIEEVDAQNHTSLEDKIAEEIFVKTHKRGEDGRFIVKIPFKPNVDQLGHTRDSAIRRFKSLENKLTKNKELHSEYCKTMKEYLTMGHMKQINDKDQKLQENLNYYIPHHAVVRTESLTTKTRVVFDASMKSSSGLSLNDVQYIGPTIQNEIFSTLLNFRLHKYVISGDISKMYRMIWLNDDHKQFHRIFWRETPHEPLNCFELQTVTFGTASAPFLAIRCLHQLAMENQNAYPKACKIIRDNFYVDDLIYGAETVSELVRLQHEISSILGSAGFYLRKWLCNDDQIYAQLNLNSDLDCNTLQFGDKTNKTLGIIWNAKQDEILYKSVPFNENYFITKRIVLSELAKIFDPLGLFGPLIVVGKLLMQTLWKLSISWDDQIPPELSQQWIHFRKDISQINLININRKVLVNNYSHVELHGFCDASEKAYGACVFIKSRNPQGQILTKLLCSKSRVAPLKQISLPKLELCGALLLAKLIKKVEQKLEVKIENSYCWSDSTIALAWIQNDPQKWKTFVANRVGEIQTLTDLRNWYHVSSSENPSDILSRGATISQLMTNQLWWSGPAWLPEKTLPEPFKFEIPEIPEQKTCVHTNITYPSVEIINRYSNFDKIIRIAAYCFRFKFNCQTTDKNRIKGELSVKELESSSANLFRLIQKHSFPEDYNNLESGKSLNTKSKLLSLNPFIDEHGLIRVGGRLEKGDLKFETKHPIILEPKHRLTKLLIKKIHFDNFHCGPTLLLSLIRQKYWPLNGRNLIKGIIKKCLVCFLAKPKSNSYIMGQLPRVRLQPSFPFENVGIDYAGPILIKDRKTRNYKTIKAYICLFVCLATKAIHLECVTELTTEGFIACLNRFIGRRGKPKNIYSDNGKNFVGARTEIQRFYKFINENKNKINKIFVNKEIDWYFIPPRSPSFGGIWEAGIKSVKHHLVRVMKTKKFDFEELTTVLCQIESLLNSRPLTPMTSDPTDLTPLTPGHFLIGRGFHEHPETTDLAEIPASRLKRYQHLTSLVQHFWKRWSREYISELQSRTKWKTNSLSPDQFQIGKIVLVKDDGYPPFQWPLGRITEVHPGDDGVTRVVSVKLRDSIVKRGVSKICVLPEED